MINTLAEKIKEESKDSNKVKAIYAFLENCYEISSLELIKQRFADIYKSQQEAGLCLKQGNFHLESASQTINDEFYKSEEKVIFFLEELEKSYRNFQDYSKNKTNQFKLLIIFIDEFWNDLPSEFQKFFDVWAKELTVRFVQEEIEDEHLFVFVPNLLKQIEAIPIHKTTAIEDNVERLKQLVNNTDVTNYRKEKLNFIASIFKQRLTIEEETIELPSIKKTRNLSKEQIHQAGMRAFENLLEDYGDVLEALAEH